MTGSHGVVGSTPTGSTKNLHYIRKKIFDIVFIESEGRKMLHAMDLNKTVARGFAEVDHPMVGVDVFFVLDTGGYQTDEIYTRLGLHYEAVKEIPLMNDYVVVVVAIRNFERNLFLMAMDTRGDILKAKGYDDWDVALKAFGDNILNIIQQ